jgi:hypothetical protein
LVGCDQGLAFGDLRKKAFEHRLFIAPMIVPEGIFLKVGLQVHGADGMIVSVDSAFQKTPKSVHCVRMNVTDNIDVCDRLAQQERSPAFLVRLDDVNCNALRQPPDPWPYRVVHPSPRII